MNLLDLEELFKDANGFNVFTLKKKIDKSVTDSNRKAA